MRRSLLCLLTLFLLGGRAAQTAPPRQPEFIPGQYLVLLEDQANESRATAADLGRRFGVQVGFVYRAALRGFSGKMTAAAARAVAEQPGVTAVIPDLRVHAFEQALPTGVNRVQVDTLTTPPALVQIDHSDEAPDIDIAIIDTGIGPHDDLRIAGGVDLTGSGSYADGHFHGTHVAGIAAAVDNDSGVVGVCSGARLWAVRVLGADGSGALSTVAAGVDWVADQSQHPGTVIEVANLSLGAYYPPLYESLFGDPLKTAILSASAQGVHFAVAAGNDSANAADYIPARYDPVICTSAMADSDGQAGGDSLASFSNYGSKVDVTAPGVGILSTTPNNTFGTYSGTSMASPHTAGAIADYLLSHPGATPAQVLSVFRNSGEAAPPGGWPGDPDGIAERAVNVPVLLAVEPGAAAADFGVTVSTNKSSYRRGETVTVTVQATDVNGAPVAGAAAGATVTNPAGASQSINGVTDSSGRYRFGIVTSRRDVLGTWTVRGLVTAGGVTRAGQVTFQLRK